MLLFLKFSKVNIMIKWKLREFYCIIQRRRDISAYIYYTYIDVWLYFTNAHVRYRIKVVVYRKSCQQQVPRPSNKIY